mmetsp:Transcript_20614/g.53277  ORF Transcript_20614/g.53277 Transcript_20614/m.53277 type:complete len:142 (+) Transcript_20614:111-536(+)|eukprot:CAMPEP_0119411720 /NCGR_PEP_ID=MMETSP1335-20130426/4378_1 /TAXON_ID=259385 /ORGANISM="Chrysoculter rhomboideus, Strain RCC1486" /LENGTH=141 /DNA_ID=CAMNT_0007436389 /DNA_START=72 /DNA_END=497 /DNA_ORIENTATION=+
MGAHAAFRQRASVVRHRSARVARASQDQTPASTAADRPLFLGRPVFSAKEVAAHASDDDCWVSAHGRVYDLTSIMRSHPGGDYALKRNAGHDCSRDFDFHSASGQREWSRYCIGWLADAGDAPLLNVAIWALSRRRDAVSA